MKQLLRLAPGANLLYQQLCGSVTDGVDVLANHAQGRRQVLGKRRIIKRDQGNVLRNLQLAF